MKDFDKESLLEDIRKRGKEYLSERPRIQSQANELTRQNDQYHRLLSKKEEAIRKYCIASETNELLKKLDQKIFSAFYQEGGILFFARQLKRYTEEILADTATVEEMWVGGYSSAIQRISKDLLALEVACRLTEEKQRELPARYEKKTDLFHAIGYQRYAPLARSLKDALDEKDMAEAQSLLQKLSWATENNRQLAERIRNLPAPPAPYEMEQIPLLDAIRTVIFDERVERLSQTEGWQADDYRTTLKAYSVFVTETLIIPFAMQEDH